MSIWRLIRAVRIVLGFAFEVPAGPSVSREFHRFFELSPDILCIVGF